jgi:hypothetical protein
VRHDVGGVVDDLGVVVVQREQTAMSFEGVEAAQAPAKPARCRIIVRRFAIAREVDTNVVEYAVEQQTQPPSMRLGDEVVEIIVVAEPGIDMVMVGGVVSVCARGEDRPQRDPRRTELDGVVEPLGDPSQPVFTGNRRCSRRKRTNEPQRVDMPPDQMPDPGRHRHRRYLAS